MFAVHSVATIGLNDSSADGSRTLNLDSTKPFVAFAKELVCAWNGWLPLTYRLLPSGCCFVILVSSGRLLIWVIKSKLM